MEIIQSSFLKEVLKGTVASGTRVNGVVLVSGYSVALTKNGKEYISGDLMSGAKVPFKAWGNTSAFSKMKAEEHTNMPVSVTGTVDNYGGTGSISLEDVQAIQGYTVDQFLEQKYNADAYYDALMQLVKANVSAEAMEVAEGVFAQEGVRDRFKVEFAASSHHDNCKSGLLAHTYKCVSLLNWVAAVYPALLGDAVKAQQSKDLLFLGVLFHDIGKIREMELGVYQNCSKVTHRYLGIEYISPFKEKIVGHFGEQWYYDLVSVLLQHHGEFGDPCRTAASYIVSKVDLLESQMTLLQQLMQEQPGGGAGGTKVRMDGAWLSLD